MFKEIDSKMDLPKVETDVLAFWDVNKTFEKSLELTKDGPHYSFYDGPPFATGTPHYGHIVASTMKDVVPRYWTMKGYSVPRVWGWDCHGLPIENIAEKELGIKQKKDIEALGVKKFNDATADRGTDIIPVEITIFTDRSFEYVLKTPPASDLLRKAVGAEKGSGEPNKKKVGKITKKQLDELAEKKIADLNVNDLAGAKKTIEGTARSMGIEIEK